jgi:phosphate transport system permease protein
MTDQTTDRYDVLLRRRKRSSKLFAWFCGICTWSAVGVLVVLLGSIILQTHHAGGITIRFDGAADAIDSDLLVIAPILRKRDDVAVVRKDVDIGGRTTLRIQTKQISVAQKAINEDGDLVETGKRELRKNRDIRREIARSLADFSTVDFPLESSERISGFSLDFLTSYPSRLKPESAGVVAGMWGSIWLVLLTATIAVPIGIGAALYLEEYAGNTWTTRLIKTNLSNLAGVPSVVYGILGFAVFVRFFGKTMRLPMTDIILLPMGKTVLTGALTLALLILPVIIVATQESLKAVPGSIRHASLALGASKWQTVWHQVLPASLSGITTGTILSLSRALGETAPIVLIGALVFTRSTPGGIESPADIVRNPAALAQVPFDEFATLPIQIYNWVSGSEAEFPALAARGILVLLVLLICINGTAILIRHRHQAKHKW